MSAQVRLEPAITNTIVLHSGQSNMTLRTITDLEKYLIIFPDEGINTLAVGHSGYLPLLDGAQNRWVDTCASEAECMLTA